MTHPDTRPPTVPCPHIVFEGTTHWCSLAQTGGERYAAALRVIRRLIEMHMPAERHWGYFWAEVGELPEDERRVLADARETDRG